MFMIFFDILNKQSIYLLSCELLYWSKRFCIYNSLNTKRNKFFQSQNEIWNFKSVSTFSITIKTKILCYAIYTYISFLFFTLFVRFMIQLISVLMVFYSLRGFDSTHSIQIPQILFLKLLLAISDAVLKLWKCLKHFYADNWMSIWYTKIQCFFCFYFEKKKKNHFQTSIAQRKNGLTILFLCSEKFKHR